MKKIIALFVVVLLLGSPISAFAKEAVPYKYVNRGSLSIQDTTAECSAHVQANSSEIHVVMKLWNDNICIATWAESNKSLVAFTRTVSVKRGETYTLTIDTTIDGKKLPRISEVKKS